MIQCHRHPRCLTDNDIIVDDNEVLGLLVTCFARSRMRSVQRQRSRSLPVAVERSSRETDDNFPAEIRGRRRGAEEKKAFHPDFHPDSVRRLRRRLREVSMRDALFMQLRSRAPSAVISGSGSRGPLVFGSRGSLGHGGHVAKLVVLRGRVSSRFSVLSSVE